MKRINSVGKWVAPMLVLLISIIIFFYTSTITYKNIGTNELFATVDAITRGYKIKQIIASVVLFIAGYLVAQGTFDKQTDAMKAAWAVPIAVVGWCMCSTVILLLRLPYIRSFAFGLVGALLGAMILKRPIGACYADILFGAQHYLRFFLRELFQRSCLRIPIIM